MKYVVRDEAGRYLKRAGLWVAQIEDALTFDDLIDVREYCQAHGVTEGQPVQRFMPWLFTLVRRKAGRAT